jgi:exosortase
MSDKISARHWAFLVFTATVLAAFHVPLHALLKLSLGDYRYSHIAVVPLVSVCLVCFGRKRVFEACRWNLGTGIPVLLFGAITYFSAAAWFASRVEDLWVRVVAIVLVWTGGFITIYGTRSFRAAMFAFGLLVFVVPIPTHLLDAINAVLQRGSANVNYVLLKLAGVPVLRDGFKFSLPGLEIEVAEECSGIRSAFALLITGILAGHIFLQTGWSRVWLGLLTVPIAIFKNGFRIATISWLSSYVDEGIIDGDLHHRGGLPFSLLALALLVAAVMVLRRWEVPPLRAGVAGVRLAQQ